MLNTSIEYLKGVGPQRAELLKKELQIFTYKDLLQLYPFRYVDKTKFYKITELQIGVSDIQIVGVITRFELQGEGRKRRLKAIFKDDTGSMELVWFKGLKWVKENYKLRKKYVIFGKPNMYGGQFTMSHPDIESLEEYKKSFQAGLQAVYPSSEKLSGVNLNSKGISKLIKNLLEQSFSQIKENLSDTLLDELKLMPRKQALVHIHFPKNAKYLEQARRRLKFEELFYIQLNLLSQKVGRKKQMLSYPFPEIGTFFNRFYKEKLPFELTGAQKRVLKEIRTDVHSGWHMNRLVQGDVGSGKTMVALMAMLIANDNGFQACLMAPTEILANQHYMGLRELLEGIDVRIALLTGSSKAKHRREVHEALESGEINILVGTHALLEDKVKFKNLGFAIVDEQHRFGVAQRAKLWKKNKRPPHVLVMTATPIPRTLAMTLYGDLDVSVIDEMPPGRKPVTTYHKYDSNRLSIFNFMKAEIAKGRQIYIVYPLIDESASMDYKDLMDGYESIQRAFPKPDYRISIVHGKMKAADKDYEMERFVNGETQIMVATTVIEVGVNVPNASVMIIESSERFGLSQLHQLRGRVGRGADQSYCILMSSHKLSKEARFRLETMVKTTNGFDIADADLKLRGPGDMMGTRQSGVLDLKIADLANDSRVLKAAREVAIRLLEEDPQLQKNENAPIKFFYMKNYKSKVQWSSIS
jgi:ATP-dependent DNA helicase RecG